MREKGREFHWEKLFPYSKERNGFVMIESKAKEKKREEKAMRKRIFAAFVCLCMMVALVPSMAYADGTVYTGGLCEHHPQHDNACGYSEATTETPCTHEHTEDCYTVVTNCVHGHTEACYSEGNAEPICGHVCSEESGCITKELNCNHEHDASCGYVPATEGTPCTYDCQICNTQTAEEAECICETKCTEEKPNADCPVCGGENGDISSCVGAAMMLAPMGAEAIEPEVPAGSGIEGDPYLITNAAELYWFANEVNNNYGFNSWAKLMDDITINENVLNDDGSLNGNGSDLEPWTPINNPYSPYTGTFDGDNHKISGLYVNSADSFVGLFGNVGTNGTIKNVGIEDSYFSSTWFSANVGSVCGKNNGGTIENCYNTGAVSNTGSSSYAGGVCGQNFNGTIKNSYNTGTVSNIGNSSYAGGVCGDNYYGTIENSYNTGAVSNTGTSPYVGGVCGYNRNKIENSYNTGIVTAKDTGLFANVGGVCGHSGSSATITSCYYLKGTAESSDGGDVLTESQFGEQNSFSGWDFGTVWQMDAILGRPVLQSSPEVEGTEEEPYLIYNAEELKGFRDMVNSGKTDICAKLMDDITINDNVLDDNGSLNEENSDNFEPWMPIGSDVSNAYVGTFDGNGHTISGLYVDSDAQNVGLFGCVGTNGKIQNVGVVDSYISATANGAIVGGVCGHNYEGTIENCYNTGTVTGSGINVGGVCGGNSWNIINCYNTGKVSTTDDRACVGGVCGYNTKNIKNCYNTGKISVTIDRSYVGGVCGMNFGGINNCYFLTGTADKGIGVSSSAFPSKATEKTENQFKSGEVAWLLNGSQNPQPWGQGSNGIPVLVDNLPKDVTCTAPVRVTIQMPDGVTEQYGYTTAGDTLAEYPSRLNGKTYTFYEDSNFATPIDTATKTYEEDTVIYAKEKKNSSGGGSGSVFFWDLKFDTNGGSDIDTVTEWEYSTIDLDEYVPEKEGYKFVGWYADKDFDKKIDEVYLTKDTTVYAKWEKIAEEVPEEPEEVEETETLSFKDVKESDWFYKTVSYAVENGLMSGMSEDIFAPNTPLTREMLAVVLYNVEGQPESAGVNPFIDVKADMWYTEAILWANENGIVAGYDNGAYGVGDFITREQFAAILYRYAQFKGYDVSVGADTNILSYADAFAISEYAYPAMQWACGAGIMGGMDDGILMPQGKATRAEAATMLMNFCKNVVK